MLRERLIYWAKEVLLSCVAGVVVFSAIGVVFLVAYLIK